MNSVTGLLQAWGRGDGEARDALFPLVHRELRRQAAGYLRRERRDHTLQPTALVHEAYVRLVGQAHVPWQNRAQFYGLAAQMMRRVLVDHARRHRAAKRPSAALQVKLEDGMQRVEPQSCELLDLDRALTDLMAIDARQGQIVEMRYFGGLSEQEVADMLAISRQTVTRDWQLAKAWLRRRLTQSV